MSVKFSHEYPVNKGASLKFIILLWLLLLLIYLFYDREYYFGIMFLIVGSQTFKIVSQDRFNITRITCKEKNVQVEYVVNAGTVIVEGAYTDFKMTIGGNPFRSRLPYMYVYFKGKQMGIQYNSIAWTTSEMKRIVSIFQSTA
ncbi:MAG: hypothetical protein RL660_2510 [Bacteroidota bacterium]|jgi:hypothetical protein